MTTSLKAFVRMMGLPFVRGAADAFEHSLRTSRPAVERFAPAGAFPYLAEHPDEARVFGESMTAKAHAQVAGVLAAYDFSGCGVVGDIGAGGAATCCGPSWSAPGTRGMLFDQPHVIARCLAKQPGERYADATSLERALVSALGPAGGWSEGDARAWWRARASPVGGSASHRTEPLRAD